MLQETFLYFFWKNSAWWTLKKLKTVFLNGAQRLEHCSHLEGKYEAEKKNSIFFWWYSLDFWASQDSGRSSSEYPTLVILNTIFWECIETQLLGFFVLFCHAACGILVPQPGMEPITPALEARVLTGPSGKPLRVCSLDIPLLPTPIDFLFIKVKFIKLSFKLSSKLCIIKNHLNILSFCLLITLHLNFILNEYHYDELGWWI